MCLHRAAESVSSIRRSTLLPPRGQHRSWFYPLRHSLPKACSHPTQAEDVRDGCMTKPQLSSAAPSVYVSARWLTSVTYRRRWRLNALTEPLPVSLPKAMMTSVCLRCHNQNHLWVGLDRPQGCLAMTKSFQAGPARHRTWDSRDCFVLVFIRFGEVYTPATPPEICKTHWFSNWNKTMSLLLWCLKYTASCPAYFSYV